MRVNGSFKSKRDFQEKNSVKFVELKTAKQLIRLKETFATQYFFAMSAVEASDWLKQFLSEMTEAFTKMQNLESAVRSVGKKPGQFNAGHSAKDIRSRLQVKRKEWTQLARLHGLFLMTAHSVEESNQIVTAWEGAGGPEFGPNWLTTNEKEELYPMIRADLQELYDGGSYTWPKVYTLISRQSKDKYAKFLKGKSLTPGQLKGIHTNKTKYTKK